MHIKEVHIQGFQAFGKPTAVGPFSPTVNCIVGSDSEKASFFNAIQFVVGDKYENLSLEKRQSLMHPEVQSAFVEIVFADNCLLVNKEVLRLMRRIDSEVDEYLLDGRHITKAEVKSVLIRAGLSSNFYHFGGKIQSLMDRDCVGLLDLMKEVGGVMPYEERLCESLKLIKQSGKKCKEIYRVVTELDKKLRRLVEENQKLKEYQQIDNQRKAIEHTIDRIDFDYYQKKLMEVEKVRDEISKVSTRAYDARLTLKKLDKELNDLRKNDQTLRESKSSFVRRNQELEATIDSTETNLRLVEAGLTLSENINKLSLRYEKIIIQQNKLKVQEEDHQRTRRELVEKLEELVDEGKLSLVRQEEYARKMAEWDQLPSDIFEMYKNKSIENLKKLLSNCKLHLKELRHENKTTVDQYVKVAKQREELLKLHCELGAGEEKMEKYKSDLDMRRAESIERTCEGVSKNFQDAFSELVEGGYGYLVLKKKDEADDDDGHRAATKSRRVQNYIGLELKVSFNERYIDSSFSEAQKIVVALALIFAIQPYKRAPFYIFEEIDDIEDDQYKSAVGNMVRKMANTSNTQFITTERDGVAGKMLNLERDDLQNSD